MTCFGSTGNIMLRIADQARTEGNEVWTYSPYPHPKEKNKKADSSEYHCFYGTKTERYTSLILGRIFGLNGLSMRRGTKKMIVDMKKKKVDLIHFHNLHSYCVYFPALIKFIKKNHIKVVWTLHDCWALTGNCAHFVSVHCEKWKKGCSYCPVLNCYPKSFLDNTHVMYKFKKKWFTSIDDLTLVTPSKWLADLVKQSFLKDYSVHVIHNGINLDVFKPLQSDFRKKYGISQSKAILLGVAFEWGTRKGLDVFINLSKRLDRDKYQIVLVGTNESVDRLLPSNIISIHRTHDQAELAEIYTAADLFVNPTREENYPTVNMEAIACGTPVLTFRTGGSPEILDETCGSVVECDDIDAMEREIIRICDEKPYSVEACINRAKLFDMNDHFDEYAKLYERMEDVKE